MTGDIAHRLLDSQPEPEPEIICRCPLPVTGTTCPDEFDQEDFLCAKCRKLHKPLFDEEWHHGNAGRL